MYFINVNNTRLIFNHPYLQNNYDYSLDNFFSSSNSDFDNLYKNSPDIKPSGRDFIKVNAFAVYDASIDNHTAANINEAFYLNYRSIHFDLDENLNNICLSKPYSDVIRYKHQHHLIYIAKGGKLRFGRKGNYALSDLRYRITQFLPEFVAQQMRLSDSFIMKRELFYNYLFQSDLRLLIPSCNEQFLHTYYRVTDLFEFIYTLWGDNDADLVYNEFKKNQIIYRRKAARLARQGDTVAAIDALFYDYKLPRSIKRLLYHFSLMPKATIATLHDCIDKYGVDAVRNLLQFLIEHQIFKYTVICIELLGIGFSWQKITNTLIRVIQSHDDHLFIDTFSMLNTVLGSKYAEHVNKPLDIKNIKDYHNHLQAIVNQIALDNNERFNLPHESVFNPFYHQSYVVRSVENTAELLKVGVAMHHCVSSYQNKHDNGDVEIMVVGNKENAYIACLEIAISKKTLRSKKIIASYSLTQAKMSYNRHVSRNALLNEVVVTWAKAHDVSINTIDVNINAQ